MMSATLIPASLLAIGAVSACSSASTSIPAAPLPRAIATPDAIDYPRPSFVASPDCENLVFGVLPVTELTISSGVAEDITLHVEVANDASERSQGLMCRDPVPPGTGMLFTYNTDRSNGYWMFNTYAPIDILYLDQSGHVVDTVNVTLPKGSGRRIGFRLRSMAGQVRGRGERLRACRSVEKYARAPGWLAGSTGLGWTVRSRYYDHLEYSPVVIFAHNWQAPHAIQPRDAHETWQRTNREPYSR